MKLLALLWVILIPTLLFPQEIKIPDPVPNSYVSDYTHTLTEAEIHSLNSRIYQMDTLSSVQIAIVIIDHLPADAEIDDYTRQLATKWGVGHANNGIVCLFAMGDHKDRIEVAEHMEGDLPDAVAFDILESLKDDLRAGKPYDAYSSMLTQITARISPAAKEQRALSDAKDKAANAALLSSFLHISIWIGILLGLGILLYFVFRKKPVPEKEEIPEPNVEDTPAISDADMLIPLAAGSILAMPQEPEPVHSHHEEDDDDDSSSSSSSSSSEESENSFGGFGGGGGFSGGGASSSW